MSFAGSVTELPLGLWSEFEGPSDYPFLRLEWLRAFEQSGTATANTGWIPRPIVVRRGGERGEIVAVAPAYIKTHSMGEFVFDHAFAEFSEARLGVRYYPKLVLAVPFTPATGPRILWRRGVDEGEKRDVFDTLAIELPRLAERQGLGSVHVLFPDDAQASELAARGWATRLGVQYQYHRDADRTFDDYLARFRSKRRAAIRRERRHVAESGIQIRALTGTELGPESASLAHELYLTTVDKYVWGRRYLNLAFFEAVFRDMPDALQLVLAERRSVLSAASAARPDVLGGALNLIGTHALYGRYWGALAEVPFLHFNVCLYQGVVETLRLGLESFQPGAGGEHKEGRGFRATATRSVHHFQDARLDRAVREYLSREAEAIASRIDADGAATEDAGAEADAGD